MFRRRNASEKRHVYSNGKARRDLNASDAVLLPFSDDVGENHLSIGSMVRGGATTFRLWGQDFVFISFTACSPNFSGGNNIVLPPRPHLSWGKLPPLPYGGAAHEHGSKIQE